MSRAFGDYDYKSNGELSRGRQVVVCAPEVEARERDGKDRDGDAPSGVRLAATNTARITKAEARPYPRIWSEQQVNLSRGAKDDLPVGRVPSARRGGVVVPPTSAVAVLGAKGRVRRLGCTEAPAPPEVQRLCEQPSRGGGAEHAHDNQLYCREVSSLIHSEGPT